MRRVGGLGASAALVMVLLGGISAQPVAAQAGATGHLAKAATLSQHGFGAFWECHAKTTEVLIGINHLTLHPHQDLTVNFLVRNLAPTACNYVAPYAGTAPGPTATTLTAGPCGSMGFEIEGAHHRNLWPGVQPFNCPALGFAQLEPNATVSGTGMWGQTGANLAKRVPSGTYTLVVDGHFSFPLRIAAH